MAEGIQAEAEAEAERYLAQKRSEADELAESQAQRLEEVLDPLRAQLRTIERTSADMISAVEAAIASTRGASVDSPEPRPVEVHVEAEAETEEPEPEPEAALEADEAAAPTPRKPVPVPAPSAYAGTGRVPDSAWGAEPPTRDAAAARGAELRESAVIRATQLAISGSARSEIEAALREDFGFEDPRPIVDEVLGPA